MVRVDAVAAVRALRAHPVVTLVIIATLACGIGINVAVFAVVNAAVFRGFAHVDRNERIVQISTNRGVIYYPDYEQWRSHATALTDIALVRGVFHTLAGGDDGPSTHFTTEVTANTFKLLHVAPFLGRDFSSSDAQPGAEPVAILRYDLWTRAFGSDPTVVGRVVRIDGEPARVIGVMPRGFVFPGAQELWMPLVPTAAALERQTAYAQYAYGRLSSDAELRRAREELEAIGRDLAREHLRTNRGLIPVVKSFDEWFIGSNARVLYEIVWGCAAFVLLVLCANVANLLLAGTSGREREFAIRLALGASHATLIRQLLLEATMVCGIGGIAAWWLARFALRSYLAMQPGSITSEIAIDEYAVMYLAAATLGATLIASLGTMTQMFRLVRQSSLLCRAGTSGSTMHRKQVADVLAGAQIVLAVVLLVGAGVFARSFRNVSIANIGADTAHVLTMSLYASPDRYQSAPSRLAFYQAVAGRLQALPGVVSVAFGTAAPTEFTPHSEVEAAGRPAADDRSRVGDFVVSPGYFQLLHVKLLGGRDFDATDRATSEPVAIVNQQLADQQWPGGSAVGQHLRLNAPGREATAWMTVIGVVANVVQNDRTRQHFEPIVYVPYAQRPQPNMFAFVRATDDPARLAAAVQRQIYAVDPNLPVPALGSLAGRFDRTYTFERQSAIAVSAFAIVSIVVSVLGLYATVSRSVSARMKEIGVRRAIGATSRDIARLVFARTTFVAAIGCAIGLTLALGLLTTARSQFVGVSASDPVLPLATIAVVAVSVALSCTIPAVRATRVDPAIVLRHE